MMYSPHILQRKNNSNIVRDKYGRIVSDVSEVWENVCKCRCDDNTTQYFESENGKTYRPKYHVVCERNAIKAGDVVRCLEGESVMAQGEVYMVKNTNYYNYTEIWM